MKMCKQILISNNSNRKVFFNRTNHKHTSTLKLGSISLFLLALLYSNITLSAPLPNFSDFGLQQCMDDLAIANNWVEAEQVTSFACTGKNVFDSNGIEQLVNLNSLDLSDNAIEFIDLFGLAELRELDLSGNALFNLPSLSTTQLTKFDVSGNNAIQVGDVLTIVQNNPGFTELGMGGIAVNDPFGFLENLRSNFTGGFDQWVALNLSDTGLVDVNQLNQFYNLQRLDLSDNAIEFIDLFGLAELRELDLSGNALIGFGPLFDLNELEFINLFANEKLLCADLDSLESSLSPSTTFVRPLSCDTDGDGFTDSEDAFPYNPSEWLDSDGDGVGDNSDVFPNDADETLDNDGDGFGDNADLDDDNDGISDDWETTFGLNPFNPNDANLDADGDGLTNLQEFENDTNPNVVEPLQPNLRTAVIPAVSDTWQTVNIGWNYRAMVVVTTPAYNSSQTPVVVRIRNAQGGSFEIKAQRVDGVALPLEQPISVHYVVVEEGVFNSVEHGIDMEAVKYTSTVTDHKRSWQGEARGYLGSYSNPVVIGQVISANDSNFSSFWSRGSQRYRIPSTQTLFVGKHVGEDPNRTRANETLAYIVLETSEGVINGISYAARVGADKVRGIQQGVYTYSLAVNSSVTSAVASRTASDGIDGGWAVLSAPLSDVAISLSIDEDQLNDGERKHTTEQVAYVVFGDL